MITISKPGVNWNRIRAEYINGKSQTTLAKKYHVSRAMISRHSMAEGWTNDRKAARSEIQQKVIQRTANAVADNAELAEKIKRKGLETLDRLFDEFEGINSTEHREIGKTIIDIKRLRDLTAAYKDLTDDMPKGENTTTIERLDAMLAEVRSHAFNS